MHGRRMKLGGPALMDAKAVKLKAYLSPGAPLDFEKAGKEGLGGGYSGLHKATYPRQGAEMWPPTHRNLRPGGNSRYGVPDSLAARPLWVVVGAFSPIIPDA